MIILGIDPGTATTGYGLIKIPDDILGREFNYDIDLVDYGFISTPKEMLMEKRLVMLHYELEKLLDQFNPDLITIEMLFFGANARTAITVGQARGVLMLSAGIRSIPIHEYTGPQVKLMVAGGGRADKKQVHEGVRNFLGKNGNKCKELMKPMNGIKRRDKKFSDDAIDALAIAICHVLKLVNK
ncbi:MAG: crossover junction endodeoxyribonuclease RuvC [Candidatus Daviesbacteria bacterium]|nr:crossover junction endodeoxyribonuclease RuvC [Candidatus Daviesbacteria bacterium]